jgi:hypothetical protein
MKKQANELNKALSKEEVQMAKKHIKKWRSIPHKDSTMLEWLSKNTNNNKCWWGCGVKETHKHCWWGCKLVQPLWKTIWRLLKKLKIELPYDPAIPLLGIYPKECKSGYNQGTCTPMLIAALFTIAKLWKQPRCRTTYEWIKKMWYLYTMKFYSVTKNGILSFAGKWVELENIILSKFSQVQKAKGHMFSLICRI